MIDEKEGSGFFDEGVGQKLYCKENTPNHTCPFCCFFFKEGQPVTEVKVESQNTSFFYHKACYLDD